MPTKARLSAATAAGALIIATGLVGLAHAPFARSLLTTLGGCPMAGARMTPAAAERARHLAIDVDRGKAPAPSRPALGFALDTTTLQETRAWARDHHVDCEDARPGLIKCTGVRPDVLGLPAPQGVIGELALEFNPQGRLVNLTTFRTHLAPAVASAQTQAIVASLDVRLGPAERRAGTFQASSLEAHTAGSISTVRYRFDDYIADVTAMNAPSSGPSILEHYMSARD